VKKGLKVGGCPKNRSFLLLQGVASPFFFELEKALNKAGYSALKINFCGGDLFSGRYFSTALQHLNFQETLDKLPAFYESVFNDYQITDILLFGDTRPVHLDAIKLAKQQNINVLVFEEGYFRPNWVTLDEGGVNAYSSIYTASQNQPDWFLQNAPLDHDWHDESQPTGGSLAIRAWHDIRYHLAKTLFNAKFPLYKTHRPDSPLEEYWGFVRRIPAVHFYYNRKAKQQIDRLLKSGAPYYLLPLQLEADSQMRLHSSFRSLEEVIQTTLESFSKDAPKDSKCVIKLHPLDPWFVDYPRIIEALIRKYGIDKERIVYLEAGNLNTLLKHCSGTILVNSTVGTSALAVDCPVIAMGSAIYNISGLTFQGSLDAFWTQASPPDKKLFEAFRRCYIAGTQINGSFYNRKGIKMAVAASIKKLAEKNDE
jgi:capsular polysaccharide export protein